MITKDSINIYKTDYREDNSVTDFDGDDITVYVGYDQYVYINKIFGATVAEPVRIHFDLQNCAWVVERERSFPCKGHKENVEEEHAAQCEDSIWEEKIRWFAQESLKDAE